LGDDIDLMFADVFNWPDWEQHLDEFATRRLEQLGSTGSAPSLDEGRENIRVLADRRMGDASVEPGSLARARHRLRFRR
jgi:hypothetical protein